MSLIIYNALNTVGLWYIESTGMFRYCHEQYFLYPVAEVRSKLELEKDRINNKGLFGMLSNLSWHQKDSFASSSTQTFLMPS